MRYLRRAFDLAEARGYLRYPEVLALEAQVPDWFRALGTEAGLAAFEARRGYRPPASLVEFYSCLPLACFLEATIGEMFLGELATITEDEPPPVVTWWGRPHLVSAFHNHSGMVFAARLGDDDPQVFQGFDDEPIVEEGKPEERFSEWVFSAVEMHEAHLDD